MRKVIAILTVACIAVVCLAGCAELPPQIVATTAPVYEFTMLLCKGTNITVGQLVTEEVSCLHDYTLQVSQMRMLEAAELVVISGAGLEEFLEDVLPSGNRVIDSSVGCHIHSTDHHHEEDEHGDHSEHHHDQDPHIWLSPENAGIMAENICAGLSAKYPDHASVFTLNLEDLLERLAQLQAYGEDALGELSCRKMVTFHDGFAYFAESFDLTILRAIEEESGSEASAHELKELILLVQDHNLPAVFTEINGSASAAQVICAETAAGSYALSMAMSGASYFETMYQNIDTVKEALE